ncbi:HD domain-containing phosphohydrolase [Hydrogenophaga taeniospiralis]|uniref:HD domain-containing phosphohydrolase n=1 Tax=Hydrogenophaga taeniospiralis TaxID=65656 RepID=UPI0009FED08A|nr:HD domain-containing phosphohydrolase [Hydrogenophaga taeniospiralis]
MTSIALQEPSSATANAGSLAVPTVLTVDDEPSVLSALRRVFRTQGIATLQATSAAEGLALLKTHRVDLVISDMRMPEMDGARFLELVRSHDEGIARILLTGYADISATIAAINKGAIHRYISKPWDDQDLVLVVREALIRRGLEQQNAELTELTKRQNEQLRDANQTLESRVAARTAELQQINGMLDAAYEDLDNTFVLAVNVFSSLMEMRVGNSGHSRRVADLSRETAKRLGLSDREIRDVHLAALVHDVGNIGFPDAMLGKPVSAYTPEETQRYRRHPIDGETTLMALSQLQGVARIVRQHHERMDGKGFPDGLAAPEIVMGARIVAVASDLDDMMHGNLGDQRSTAERAQRMLHGGIDTRYDRSVVETMIKVVDDLAAAAKADVHMDVRDLRPGMVLARDLVSSRGAILLAAGYVFDERVVKQVGDFSAREGVRLTLWVRKNSIPQDTKRLDIPGSQS